MLLSSVLSSMPMWRLVDPLPVFAFMDRDDAADKENESLDALIEQGEQQAANKRLDLKHQEPATVTQQK